MIHEQAHKHPHEGGGGQLTPGVPRCRVKVQPVNPRVPPPPPRTLALNEGLTASLPQQHEGSFTSGGSQKNNRGKEEECVVASQPGVHSCLFHPSQLKAALGLLRDCFDSRLPGGSNHSIVTQLPPLSCISLEMSYSYRHWPVVC